MKRKSWFSWVFVAVLIVVQFPAAAPKVYATPTVNTIQFTPGDSIEATYAYENDNPGSTQGLLEQVTKFRVAEGAYHFTYRVTQPVGSMALLSLTLSNQYLVRVSSDNATWTNILDFDTNGSFKEERSVDISSFFASSGTVYIRFEDKVTSDGWGGALWYFKLQTIDSFTNTPASMAVDATNGWSVSIDGGSAVTKNAGDPVSMGASSTATFTKTVSVPTWWAGLSKTVQFGGVAGQADIYVNNVLRGQSAKEQQPFSISLSDAEIAGGSVALKAVVKANPGTSGTQTVGLWSSIKVGWADLLLPTNMASRSFNGTTVPINKRYYSSIDAVQFNWLGANYLQSLYSDFYQLNGFDDFTRSKKLFYVHDSLRAIGAFAEEERYSPVVRLDLIRKLYEGTKKALVPGSSYEFFLKIDQRPKKVRQSPIAASSLELSTDQDVNEPFADIHFSATKPDTTVVTSAGSTYSDSALTESGGQFTTTRTYTAPGASPPTVALESKYWLGDMDTPTQVKYTTTGSLTKLTSIVDNLDGRWQGAHYPMLETPSRAVSNASSGDFTVSNPTYKYLILKQGSSGFIKSLAVIWDGSPSQVKVTASGGNYTSVQIQYSSWMTPTVRVVPFEYFDPNMNWPHTAASNIVSNGKYGANGFDPTYAVNLEGLGAYTAAAAYILKKYDDPLGASAETFAKSVMDGLIDADTSRGAQAGVLLGPIAGAEYLVRAGNSGYGTQLQTWGDRILADQDATLKTWMWYDLQTRNMIALLRAYESSGLSKYLTGYTNARNAMTYSSTGVNVRLKGQPSAQTFGPALPLMGGADVGFLGHQGDWTALGNVGSIETNYYNDSGIWNTSDLNPYYVGFSLKASNLVANFTDKRHQLKLDEYAKYDANGITILHAPTAYMNQPDVPAVKATTGQLQLSNKNLQGGLALNETPADGATTYVSNAGGRTARRTTPASGSTMMYFDVDDNLMYNLSGGQKTRVTVSYYDTGTDSWGLQYDGASNDFQASGVVPKTNSGAWLERRFVLGDAQFANAEGGADMRLNDQSDGTDYVSSVKVEKLPQTTTYESESLYGATGIVVSDGAASGGQARKARNGTDVSGYMQFGPYTYDQGAGDYTAAFTLKVSSNASASTIATIDAYSVELNTVINSKTIKANDFTAANTYQTFSFPINGVDLRKLEYRINWTNGIADLYADKVTVTPIQPVGMVYDEGLPAAYFAKGSLALDEFAVNKKARKVTQGTDTAGHIQFGPYDGYSQTAGATYKAYFRMKTTDNSSTNNILTLDAFNLSSSPQTVASLNVKGTDFAKAGLYQTFVLTFTRPTGGNMEYRVYWGANAPAGTSVYLDEITVEKQ